MGLGWGINLGCFSVRCNLGSDFMKELLVVLISMVVSIIVALILYRVIPEDIGIFGSSLDDINSVYLFLLNTMWEE